MVKLLVVGSIQGEWTALQRKVSSLHASSHGPFDALFCTGTFFRDTDEYTSLLHSLTLPLPTYILDNTGIPTDTTTTLHNLHVLPSVGSVEVVGLRVASVVSGIRELAPVAYDRLVRSAEELMHFRGYDVLLSAEWPAGVSEGVVVPPGITIPTGSKDVSELACRLAPRYHFTSTLDQEHFYQRAPYTNCTSDSSDANATPSLTRFIGMARVSDSKDKTRKWIHALSLEPCATTTTPLTHSLASATACPYASHTLTPSVPHSASGGVDSSGRKRKLEDTVVAQPHSGEGAFFFGAMGVPRATRGSDSLNGERVSERVSRDSRNLQPPTPDARTLFVGGLTPQLREQDLVHALVGATSVRMPNGKNFAFVEFESHQAAVAIVTESQTTMGVSVKGRPVTIGWATGASNSGVVRGVGPGVSESSCSLFIGGLGARTPSEYVSECESEEDPVRAQLEASLLGLFPHSVAVHLLPGKSFAFVDFKSHEAAREVMDKYSADNTCYVLPGAGASVSECVSEDGSGSGSGSGALTVGWAQGKPTRRAVSQGREYDNAASHNADCWFCLASSTIKVHLIVSVGEAMYLSLPRGGVTDWHVLLIPIECVSTRAQLSAAAARDLTSYQNALQRHFITRNLACLRFERALRTQGQRNHMQVHVVPLTEQQASEAISVFLALCGHHKVTFHEIPDARLSVEEFLVNLPGGPHSEYFCIEIPYGELQRCLHRRFVFVQPSEGVGQRVRFPMSFGTEAAAKMIGQPERANWKHCMMSEEEETRLTEEFRTSFQKFDFTAQ